MGKRLPTTDLSVDPITDEEWRNAGLNVLDALPNNLEDALLTERYLKILEALGFDE